MTSEGETGLKILRIKSGIVKRLTKEQQHYEKEAEALKTKIEEMKAQGKDAYEVLKREEVLEESAKMVPECRKRLTVAFGELKDVIDKEEHQLKETEEFKAGLKLLEEAKSKISHVV